MHGKIKRRERGTNTTECSGKGMSLGAERTGHVSLLPTLLESFKKQVVELAGGVGLKAVDSHTG